jgi:hypothetical protein
MPSLNRVLAIVLLGVGCNTPERGPSSYDDFREQAIQNYCEHQMFCGHLGKSETTHCPLEITLNFPAKVDLPASIELGRMKFSPAAAQRCLDALKSAPCDRSLEQAKLRRACQGIVRPAAPIGGTCHGPGECVGGECVQRDPSTCGGRCVAFLTLGSACVEYSKTPEETCDPSTSFCAREPVGSGVGPFTCHPRRQIGQPCSGGTHCASGLQCNVTGLCADEAPILGRDAQCAVGMLCDQGLYCAGTCTAQKGEAESCNSGGACQDGLQCHGLRYENFQLTQLGDCSGFSDLGGACDPSATIGSTGCPGSQVCEAGTCVFPHPFPDFPPPTVGYHQACGTEQCHYGLVCVANRCEFPVSSYGACP